MGCGFSTPQGRKGKAKHISSEMGKSEKSMKAALLIQRWYRLYQARLEARRRCTWSIFQSLEYAGEQDQLRLYNFFNDMMVHLQLTQDAPGGNNNIVSALQFRQRSSTRMDSIEEEDAELLKLTDPDSIHVPVTYKGPHLKFPLTMNQIECLIEAFERKQRLHAKYVLQLLHEVRKVLKRLPNINHASTSIARHITVCGDLHGKIDDLFIILYKNGFPGVNNPYVFNGDFVDRGVHSVEIAVLLFAFLLVHPSAVYINRGNHEDHVMNLRYGFIKEVMAKYKNQATKVVRLFEDVFSWLPLATVIDKKILVTHGGVSDKTDLEFMATIDRHKYLSALRPPVKDEGEGSTHKEHMDKVDFREWRQVLDVLWSDPKPQLGCKPNTFRGGGSYFGPDITDKILRKHNLQLLIRSHECKPEGYEFTHNSRVLTIFSASNYYEIGSNKGAYVKLEEDLQPHIIQYMATKGHAGRKLTVKQKISLVEDSALRSLREKIYAHKSVLLDEFQRYDPANIGLIKVADWCNVMYDTLQIEVPWRSLRGKLVRCSDNGLVEYHTTFEDFQFRNRLGDDGSDVTEALYRNKANLETIFRAIDKDNSGLISMEEFEDACSLLGQHIRSPIPKEHVQNMAQTIDINKDGNIDFNEFLEAFRIVDQFGRDLIARKESLRRASDDSRLGSVSSTDDKVATILSDIAEQRTAEADATVV